LAFTCDQAAFRFSFASTLSSVTGSLFTVSRIVVFPCFARRMACPPRVARVGESTPVPAFRPAQKRPLLPLCAGFGGLPAISAGVARLIALSCFFGPSLLPPFGGYLHDYGLC